MPKIRYRFNPDTLHYEKIELSLKKRIAKAIPRFLLVSIITVFFIFILSDFIDTPQERRLKRENKELKFQYELLDKRLSEAEKALVDIKRRDKNIYRIIFEAEPLPEDVRSAGYGGVNKYKKININLIKETAQKLDKLTHEMVVQSKSYDEIIKLAKQKKEFFKSLPSISPISDRNFKRFASGFGYRIHPIYKTRKMHTGVDLTAPRGTKVYVTGDGKVIKAGSSTGGYGNVIIIDHGFGYKTLYAHLSKVEVHVNQRVKRGEEIGLVGSTGRSIAPHLHYEVRYYDKPVNPINYYFSDITPEEYDRMILISSRPNQSLD